jgi:hypothetical protein
MNGKYIIGEKDMKIKLEITLDELDILVDSLDSELQIQESFIGDKDEDEYDRKLYEETKALMDKLDQRLLKEKEKNNDN